MRMFRTALFALAVACITGCGRGERLYDVSGSVTHNGKRVPRGLVYFDPDPAKGTKGQQGFATIKDGKFDTASDGKGIAGGAYIIRVLGYDGKERDELPFGSPLFDEHLERRDLPRSNSEQNFDLGRKGK